MANAEAEQLELLAQIDALVGRMRRWAASAPDWPPAETCRALVERLADRAEALRVRIAQPLVVATLGGTGTGKSALVNALVGEEVLPVGRQRPTTTRPALVCRPDITPEMLGIDPEAVELVQRDLPALANLVLLDCPDPDTTEPLSHPHAAAPAERVPAAPQDSSTATRRHEDLPQATAAADGDAGLLDQRPAAAQTNLARLRGMLPHCDVLLVTTTQQKYRSARVAEELRAAASGARLVFVQTHADQDDDIREDWRRLLEKDYRPDHIFRIDCLGALAQAKQHRLPDGEFGRLVDLLTQELAGVAAARIRRTNFLELAAETLARCRRHMDPVLPAVERLLEAIAEQRAKLADQLARRMQEELLATRRPWEIRLLERSAARWGLSPFAVVLRAYVGLGGLLSGAILLRARTPAQMALLGALEGGRSLLRARRRRVQPAGTARRAAAGVWEPAVLHQAALVLQGYAVEAQLPGELLSPQRTKVEAEQATEDFVSEAAGQLDGVIARLAARRTGRLTRLFYEALWIGPVGWLLFRLGRNFFYESYLRPESLLGLDFYVQCLFWLLLWSLVLIWMFSRRLRRGLVRELDRLARQWRESSLGGGLFARAEHHCRAIQRFRRQLDELAAQIERLRTQPGTGR